MSLSARTVSEATLGRLGAPGIDAGSRAMMDAPLARLQLEADGEPEGAAILLTLWPTGETREIGRADFHGRWVKWVGWENSGI